MKKITIASACSALLFYASATLASESPPHSLSLHGYTGALNVPSAYTAPTGMANLQYADAFITPTRYDHNHNTIASFGLLPWLEAGGRITWDSTHTNCYLEPCGVRDLSANIKLRVPFIPDDWFALAIGAQDVGGQASYFESQYIVASKQMRYGRIDLGAGRTDQPDRYLDGAFAAVELQPWPWLGLIAEYDAQNTNAGFRLGLPAPWQYRGIQPELKVLALSDRDSNENRSFFAFSLNIPLGGGKAHKPAADKTSSRLQMQRQMQVQAPVQPQATALASQTAPATNPPIPANALDSHYFDTLAQQLARDKFENIRVGELNGELYVEFENNQFNRNELDALGLVLKHLAQHAGDHYATAHAILLNQRTAVLDVAIQPAQYRDFLTSNQSTAPWLDVRQPHRHQYDALQWRAKRNYGLAVKPSFTISPSLVTAVATEYGVWDYSWSLQTDMSLSLWQGAMANATYNMPVDESDDFDRYVPRYHNRGVFYPDRQRSGFDEYEIQQTLKLASGLYTSLHAGQYRQVYDGYYNQTVWQSTEGRHKFTLRAGRFYHDDDITLDRDLKLISYRYFLPSRDLSIEITQGEFWQGDKGYRVDTKFWFGDTAITLEYKDTDAQFVGMRITLPLTPRRDLLTPWGQIKGKENWNYGLQTRINEDANTLSFGNATVLRARQEIERTYLNNDRLSPAYVKAHWQRLREAALAFDP